MIFGGQDHRTYLGCLNCTQYAADSVFIVTLNITNTGGATANNVTLTGAELNSTQTSTAVPVSIGNLPYSAFATATMTFLASSGAPGSVALMKIDETFSGGTAGGGFRITLP
jgi:hypothetical protein